MKTVRRGSVARRFRLRTRIKAAPRRVEDPISPGVTAILELLLESMRGGGRDADSIMMSLAEEITPRPERLEEIMAELPPSPYNYDDEGEMAY